MTTTYKNMITKSDLPVLLAVFKKHLAHKILQITATFAITITILCEMQNLIYGKTYMKNFSDILITFVIASLLTGLFVHLTMYMIVKARMRPETTKEQVETLYAILHNTHATDRQPKDNTEKADIQEALFGLWILLFSEDTLDIEPGGLPTNRITAKIQNDKFGFTETFVLPAKNRILGYSLDENKNKQIYLQKGKEEC